MGIMEAFLKKYGLNESEISEFREHAVSVTAIIPNRTDLLEKLTTLSKEKNDSKGELI